MKRETLPVREALGPTSIWSFACWSGFARTRGLCGFFSENDHPPPSRFELNDTTMETSRKYSSDIAFTPTIKAVQTRKGSRNAYHRVEERGSWQTRITPDLAAFIGAQTSIFLATINAEGQPYIQHRGGPPGFLRVLDERTIGFVDYSGTGNTSRRVISRITPKHTSF